MSFFLRASSKYSYISFEIHYKTPAIYFFIISASLLVSLELKLGKDFCFKSNIQQIKKINIFCILNRNCVLSCNRTSKVKYKSVLSLPLRTSKVGFYFKLVN